MQSSFRVRSILVAALLCLVLAGGAMPSGFAEREQYWPQWRGPNANGVAPAASPPLEWSESENVAWKVAIPGRGSASPIVWDDRIFVLTAVPSSGGSDASAPEPVEVSPRSSAMVGMEPFESEWPLAAGTPQRRQQRPRQRGGGVTLSPHEFRVYAIARATGGVLWEVTAARETPHEGRQPNNSFASASAVTDGEIVLAYFGSRGLFCYDLDGTLQWQKDLGDMRTRSGFGEGSSPTLFGNVVTVTWDHEGQSFIVALDKRTGSELWRQNRDEPTTWATPLIVEHEGRTQVITGGTNRVRSYDLASGELIWEGKGLTPNAIPSPVFGNGIVYLTSGYRGNALQAINLSLAQGDIGSSGALLWEHNRDTPYVSSPLLYDGTLYFLKSNSGILSAFDVATGQPHYGPVRLQGISEVYASPVGAAGRVYILGRDGNALVIRNSAELEVLAQNSLDDGFDASPAVVGDEIYLRGYRYLYRISED